MSTPEVTEKPNVPNKRKFLVTIHYKGQMRRGRVNITTTEQLRTVIYSHYKITEKDKHEIYFYSHRDKKWMLFPEERGVLPDDLRLVIKEKPSGDEIVKDQDPVITSSGPDGTPSPADEKEDDTRPGPPKRTPPALPKELAEDLPKRTFIMSLYYKEQTFKVKGLENFIIEYHSSNEKKWVPFPLPDHLSKPQKPKNPNDLQELEQPLQENKSKEEECEGENNKKERIYLPKELPERLHLLLLDRPKDPSIDVSTLIRPTPTPYPGADQVIRKIRSEMKIKRFTILLYYKDAKKKGRISVEHSEDLKKLVFETFGLKYPCDTLALEYLTEPENDTNLAPDVRAKGGKWSPIPVYDPRTFEFKNILTEEEKKKAEEVFFGLPDPIKLLVRDVQASPRPELTKLEIPRDWTEYHNEKFGISVMHPPNFQFFVFDFPGQPLTSVTFVNPAQPLGQVVLMLEDHPIKLEVEEYHEKSMMSLRMMSGSVVNVADPMTLKAGAGGLALPSEDSVETDPSTGKKMKNHRGIITRFRVKNFQSMGQTFHVWQGAVTNTFNNLRSFLVQNISPQVNDPNVKIARLMYHSLKIFQPEFMGKLEYHSQFGRIRLRVPNEDWYIQREEQASQPKTGIVFQGTLLDKKAVEAEKLKRVNEKRKHLASLPSPPEDPQTGEIMLTEKDIEEIHVGLTDISSDVVWNTKVLGGVRIMQHAGSVAETETELLETFRNNYVEHGSVKDFRVEGETANSIGYFTQEKFHSAIKIYKFKYVDIIKEKRRKKKEKTTENPASEASPPPPGGSLLDILSDALEETDQKMKSRPLETEKLECVIHSDEEEEEDDDDFSLNSGDYEVVEREVETEYYYSVVLQSKISEDDLRKKLVQKVFPTIRPLNLKMLSINPVNKKSRREYPLVNQDFLRYSNTDFNFSVDYPVGMEIKEHADSDPVVTILSPKLTIDGKLSKNHFEIAVSCRAAPMEMTLHEVYTMLKDQYKQNREIKMLSLKRDERNQAVICHFRQKPEGVVPVNIDQEHRRDQLFSLNFYVTSFLLTKTKTATLRTVCLEENTSKQGYLELFKMIHASLKFDIEKVKDNPNYKPIVV